MNSSRPDPFGDWRDQHPHASLSRETNQRISQWLEVSHAMLNAFDQFEDEIEPWLKGKSKDEPDLVEFISRYGFIIEVTGNWTELPIDIPENEVEHWDKHSSLVVTMEQLEDWRAAVSGSAIQMLQINTELTISTIKKQLHARYEALAEQALRPLRDFTPKQWSDIGWLEDGAVEERRQLDVIFKLFESLHCFEQGIEMLRMITITEDDPDFDLPNKAFYEALVSIDSQTLMEALHLAEPKLKEILALWSTTVMQYHGSVFYQEDENAPDTFWWRHWKQAAGRKSPSKRSGSQNRRVRK